MNGEGSSVDDEGGCSVDGEGSSVDGERSSVDGEGGCSANGEGSSVDGEGGGHWRGPGLHVLHSLVILSLNGGHVNTQDLLNFRW